MSKRRTAIFVSVFCIAVLAIILIGTVIFLDLFIPKAYSVAKTESVEILEDNQLKFEECAVASLNGEKDVAGNRIEYTYSAYRDEGYVVFEIDSQGMLGGQYWDLVYTQDGTFYGESEAYLYKETGGNNIIKAERLNEHWWFRWIDYDGDERSFR